MPRVTRGPRSAVKDRPGRWRLLLRRQKRLLRPAGWVAFAAFVMLLGLAAVRSAAPGGTLATLRERLGGATAFAGLRVTDVVIEGRANTPEPLLRAALGVSKGDPILGFSVERRASAWKPCHGWNTPPSNGGCRAPSSSFCRSGARSPSGRTRAGSLLIDRNGQVVTNENLAEFRQLPLVVGPGAPGAAATLIDALTDRPALQKRVIAAVRIAERRWNLRLNNGADVMLPEGHEVQALDRLMQLQQEHALLDRPLAAIDMRLGDRLVVRPRPDEKKPT